MTAASDLWAAVKVDYDAGGLLTLTNIRNRAATTINDTIGTSAAQAVVNLFPMHAQVDYDSTNAAHVECGKLGVIAVLWRRGGSASAIEQVKWDEVFGDAGVLSKLKRTGPRGRVAPVSNSGVTQAPEQTSDGSNVRGWSDPESLPVGLRAFSDGNNDLAPVV